MSSKLASPSSAAPEFRLTAHLGPLLSVSGPCSSRSLDRDLVAPDPHTSAAKRTLATCPSAQAELAGGQLGQMPD